MLLHSFAVRTKNVENRPVVNERGTLPGKLNQDTTYPLIQTIVPKQKPTLQLSNHPHRSLHPLCFNLILFSLPRPSSRPMSHLDHLEDPAHLVCHVSVALVLGYYHRWLKRDRARRPRLRL